mgnify:FL=1
MDSEKIKTILKDLKNVVSALESELDTDKDACSNLDYEQIYPYITDYDEVFMDEEWRSSLLRRKTITKTSLF